MQLIESFYHHHSLDSLEAINYTLRKAADVCRVSPQITTSRQYSKLQIVDGLFIVSVLFYLTVVADPQVKPTSAEKEHQMIIHAT